MTVSLILESENGNIDISSYLDVEEGAGMDPADPEFTEKVFAHSLLKQGATLALEDLKLREMVFPLKLNADPGPQENPILDPGFTYDKNGVAPSTQLWNTVASFFLHSGATLTAINTNPAVYSQASHIFGLNSFCEIKTSGAETVEGATTQQVIPVEKGVPMTIFVSLHEDTAGQKVSLGLGSAEVGSATSIVTQTASGAWTRHSVTLVPTATGTARFAISNVAATAATILFAAVSPTEGYFDGDVSGYRWSGTPGSSASINYAGKDGLTELTRDINVILNTSGCIARWRDEGASKPTYFELASGQCDPQFAFRMGQQNWLPAKLRLFAQPLGFREKPVGGLGGGVPLTVSGIATTAAVGTMPIVVFNAASSLGGDAAALLSGEVKTLTEGLPRFAAMSVLPTPDYEPVWSAASPFQSFQMTPIATNNSIGGSFLRAASTSGASLDWIIPEGGVYVGDQRLLLIARAKAAFSGLTIEIGGNVLGPNNVPTIAAAPFNEWSIYDLGVASIPPILNSFEGFALVVQKKATLANGVDIAGIVMLPEDSTAWVKNNFGENNVSFNGIANAVFTGTTEDATGESRGAIPQIKPSNTPPTIAFLLTGEALSHEITGSVTVCERTRYVF